MESSQTLMFIVSFHRALGRHALVLLFISSYYSYILIPYLSLLLHSSLSQPLAEIGHGLIWPRRGGGRDVDGGYNGECPR